MRPPYFAAAPRHALARQTLSSLRRGRREGIHAPGGIPRNFDAAHCPRCTENYNKED